MCYERLCEWKTQKFSCFGLEQKTGGGSFVPENFVRNFAAGSFVVLVNL